MAGVLHLPVQRGLALRVAEATWLLLLVAVPAAFNPFGELAFEPLKTSLVRVGGVVIAVAWLARRSSQRAAVATDVSAHPIVRSGLLLLAAVTLSTAFSIEPALSFFGSFDRGLGWLNLAAGGAFLICGADLFADESRRERAISMLVAGAVVPCAYFLLQRIDLDPVTWTTLGAPGSSLGSPTFLGGYLVLVAPFAAYRVITAASRHAPAAYGAWLAVLLVVCAVTLLATIRGPILGLGAALLTFAVVARPRRQIGHLEVAAALGLMVVALALAIAVTGTGGTIGLQRFLTIARPSDSSVERLTVWRDAVGLPLADLPRAVVGFGPETQRAVLERGEATVRLTQNQEWDRAHNLLLDTWLAGGLLGVTALIGVLVVTAHSMLRATQQRTGGLLAAAILAALVGHVVEAMFAFETVASTMVLWLVLGLAASLAPRFVERGTVRRWPVSAGLCAGVLLVPLLATPAIADALYGAARGKTYAVAAQTEEVAAAWTPWVEELPRMAGLDWQQVAVRNNDAAAGARVEPDLLEAARRAPATPLPWLRLSRLRLTRGDTQGAEVYCQRALANGPFRASVWDACADVAAALGSPDA
ncbi:MAG TPA: O-antigen ligase family protein, partial [Chloroflexota bacterium]|nr:O-antigen ligase family protein [Chloroflexota bacterium]